MLPIEEFCVIWYKFPLKVLFYLLFCAANLVSSDEVSIAIVVWSLH